MIALSLWGLLNILGFLAPGDSHLAEGLWSVVLILQWPGYLMCAAFTPGSIEGLDNMHFLAIAAPVNAAFYAIVVFVVLRIRRRVIQRT